MQCLTTPAPVAIISKILPRFSKMHLKLCLEELLLAEANGRKRDEVGREKKLVTNFLRRSKPEELTGE